MNHNLSIVEVPCSAICIGERHRKDLGDLEVLAASIATEGLLQPIGITEDNLLVFGERRLRAVQEILKRDTIAACVVHVRSITAGEYAENEIRKDFTPSERVAIGKTLEAETGDRQGRRTDIELPQHIADVERGREAQDPVVSELRENIPEVRPGTRTAEIAARMAGFGNHRHGLRRTNEDKQRTVKAALVHPSGRGLSDRRIARHCGVTHPLVAAWREKLRLSGKVCQVDRTRTVTRRGTTYQQATANIGRRSASPRNAETAGAHQPAVEPAETGPALEPPHQALEAMKWIVALGLTAGEFEAWLKQQSDQSELTEILEKLNALINEVLTLAAAFHDRVADGIHLLDVGAVPELPQSGGLALHPAIGLVGARREPPLRFADARMPGTVAPMPRPRARAGSHRHSLPCPAV